MMAAPPSTQRRRPSFAEGKQDRRCRSSLDSVFRDSVFRDSVSGDSVFPGTAAPSRSSADGSLRDRNLQEQAFLLTEAGSAAA